MSDMIGGLGAGDEDSDEEGIEVQM